MPQTIGRERVAFLLTSDETGGDLLVLDVLMPPGGGPPMLHRHDPFELYRVRSGELAFYVEGVDGAVARTVGGPGAVVPIAGGRKHTIRNESGEPAEAVVAFSPGEPMERFGRAAAELEDPGEVLALAEAHGIEMTRSIDDARAEARTPYLTFARFAGDGESLLEEYRKYAGTMAGVGCDHGLILHGAARTDAGLLVVNVWRSKAGSEAAARDPRRAAVLQESGIHPGEILREHYELEELLVDPAQPVGRVTGPRFAITA
jgi:mannose-6-phosphate isomerase-like protein (cupin superfamily)